MPHALSTLDFTPMGDKFAKMIRKLYEQLVRIVNGQLSFGNGSGIGDNMAGVWAAVEDTGSADTNFTITHNLLYIPTGYIVMNQSIAGSVYQGSLPWTTTQITLKCSTAHANILIFIL